MASKRSKVRLKNSSKARTPKGLPSGQRQYPMPKEINLQGIKIPVVVGDCPEEGAMGMFLNSPSPTIFISKDIAPSEQRSTLFHEALEAISAIYNLELTENAICTLEVALQALMRDNPKLKLFAKKI